MKFNHKNELVGNSFTYTLNDIESIHEIEFFKKAILTILETQYNEYVKQNKRADLHPRFLVLDSLYYPKSFREKGDLSNSRKFGFRIFMINYQTQERFPISVDSFTYQQLRIIDVTDLYDFINRLKYKFLKSL